eukprot:jgi/Ulvmu1/8683/UM047_0023.1
MIGRLTTFLALLAAACSASAEKVSVEASSSSGKATVLVNGKPVEPGERDVDGSHVNYQQRSESDGQGSCRYSSVSVSSSGEEPTNIQVQQGSGCGAHGGHHHHRHHSFSHQASSHGMGADMDDRDEFPGHRRSVKDRRFFDIDNMINELRQGQADGDDMDDDAGEWQPDSHTERNSGTGAPGERREVHVDGDGMHARARTSGGGAHEESVTTTTRRTSGGGVSRTVRASASSSSSNGQSDD